MEKATDKGIRSQQDTVAVSPIELLLNRIDQSEEFPTISKYISEINRKLAANPDTSDATDLANIILKDHALTSKLLKMVNSAYYGLAAGKVSTITRAVVVLGHENVRLATLSLALFEHFKGKANADHLKEAVIASFWSGIVARELAAVEGGIDPEEAFVCSMMNHLGKLVMINYLPGIYRKIINTMLEAGMSEAKAVKSVCGVSYPQLGIAIAKQWNFPLQISETMQPLSTSELRNRKFPPDRLRVFTGFVKDLHSTIQDGRLAADGKHLRTLLKRYQPFLSVTAKQLNGLVKKSLENVHLHAQALSLDVANSSFLGRLMTVYEPQRRNPADATPPDTPEPAGDSYYLKDDSQLKTAAGIPDSRDPKEIILAGIQELSQIMMADYDMDTIAVMSMEILYRSLDVQRALMFIYNRNDNKMSVRFGYGKQCEALIENLDFDVSRSKDLFNLSIQSGKDLIVADAHDSKIQTLIPPWYRQRLDAPSFIFLPLVFKKVCLGALYADRDTEGLPLSETEHRYLGMLRNQLILSIRYKQALM